MNFSLENRVKISKALRIKTASTVAEILTKNVSGKFLKQ